ncbi:kelch-like protein 12 isoform X2 [Antedon mediterranea]|uniref:kelch-like protein 12 isoform X2 n=1 Tax=Antedon mediterranea TaxID=105859 RepID=UPI003AF837E3
METKIQSEGVMLRDSFHALNILSVLDTYRKEGRMCDVVLCCEGHSIPAHRVVLMSFSAYFEAMFNSNMSESSQSSITIHSIVPSALDALIEFAYTGNILINENNAQDILVGSSMLQITTVTQTCSQFIQSQLVSDNAIGIHFFAKMYSCTELLKAADWLITKNFVKVAQSNEFLELDSEKLKKLLNDTSVRMILGERIVAGISQWFRYDPQNRRDGLQDIIEYLKLQGPHPHLMNNVNFDLCDVEDQEMVDIYQIHTGLLAIGGVCEGLTLSSNLFYAGEGTGGWCTVTPSSVTLAPLNQARSTFGIATDGSDVYVAVEYYENISNSWKLLTPLQEPRNGCQAAMINNMLLVAGGLNNDYLKSVEMYKVDRETWCYVQPMNFHRGFFAVDVIGGMVYAAGGTGGQPGCNDYLSTVERYDSGHDKWTALPEMNEARGNLSCAVLNRCFYAIGGFNGHFLKTVERLDPRTNRWVSVASLRNYRSSSTSAILDGTIYTIGGFDSRHVVYTVEKYDPVADCWLKCDALPARISGLQAVSLCI